MNLDTEKIPPLKGKFISFLLLTLPVLFYFITSEKSKNKGTIGKRVMSISVENNTTKPTHFNIIKRNILKFLPWEIAHSGVHWLIYCSNKNIEPPFWVWAVLILPQIAVFIYILSIIYTQGKSSIYDKISKTYILKNKNATN